MEAESRTKVVFPLSRENVLRLERMWNLLQHDAGRLIFARERGDTQEQKALREYLGDRWYELAETLVYNNLREYFDFSDGETLTVPFVTEPTHEGVVFTDFDGVFEANIAASLISETLKSLGDHETVVAFEVVNSGPGGGEGVAYAVNSDTAVQVSTRDVMGLLKKRLQEPERPVEILGQQYMLCIHDFAGFYHSIHDEALDHQVEMMFSDDQGNCYVPEKFSLGHCYDQIKHSYGREFVEALREYLADELEIDLSSLTFHDIESPREYNFQTDRLFATIDHYDLLKLQQYADTRDLHRVIAEHFRPRKGFIPHYSDDPADWSHPITQWDHNELGCLFEAATGGIDDMAVLEHADPWHEKVSSVINESLTPEMAEIAAAFDPESPKAILAYDEALEGP